MCELCVSQRVFCVSKNYVHCTTECQLFIIAHVTLNFNLITISWRLDNSQLGSLASLGHGWESLVEASPGAPKFGPAFVVKGVHQTCVLAHAMERSGAAKLTTTGVEGILSWVHASTKQSSI